MVGGRWVGAVVVGGWWLVVGGLVVGCRWSVVLQCATQRNWMKIYFSLEARDGFTQPIFYKRFDRFNL